MRKSGIYELDAVEMELFLDNLKKVMCQLHLLGVETIHLSELKNIARVCKNVVIFRGNMLGD